MARTVPQGEQGDRILKRRILVGNALSYTGMGIALVVYFSHGEMRPGSTEWAAPWWGPGWAWPTSPCFPCAGGA